MKLQVAVPNKGRLSEKAIDLITSAGYDIRCQKRALSVVSRGGELEVMFARAGDIPGLLQMGVVQMGITGRDLVLESEVEAQEVLPLGFGRADLVLAAPEGVGKVGTIATSFPKLAKEYCRRRGMDCEIVELDGAVELAPKLGIADAIVDITSTGETLRMNGLEVMDTVMESEACLFAGAEVPEEGEVFLQACESVLAARGKRFLFANAPRSQLEKIRQIAPGLTSPTITSLYGNEEMCAIQVSVDVSSLSRVLYELKKVGAEGILITNLERMIY